MTKYSSYKIWRLQLWKTHFEDLVRIGDTANCWYFLNLSYEDNFIQGFLNCHVGSILCSVSGWLVFWIVYCLIEFPILIPDISDSCKNSEIFHEVDAVAQETSLLFHYLNSVHNTNRLEADKIN